MAAASSPAGAALGRSSALISSAKSSKYRALWKYPHARKSLATAVCEGIIAVGGKVQAQGVQCRGTAGFKGLPIPGHQAAALLVLNHQRFGGVLPGQVGLGEAGVSKDLHIRADGQIVQCADSVGGAPSLNP